jgi:preprotein translocase subunit Sec61beta
VRGLGAIAVKCVGVFVLVGSLHFVETALVFSTGGGDLAPRVVVLITWACALVQVLVGLALVLWAGRLAGRWFDDSPVAAPAAPRIVLRLALLVAGVVLVALAVPGLLQAATYGVVESSSGDGFGMTTQVSWDWINWLHGGVYPLVELVVGLLLVIFSERLSRRLWRDEAATPAAKPPAVAPPAPASLDEG